MENKENEILELFGLNFNNLTFNEALDKITFLIDFNKKIVIFTPNVAHITKINEDPNIRNIYCKADLILNDSQVLYFASRMLGKPLKGKISGSDLLPALCKVASLKGYHIFFLGGPNNSSHYAAEKLKQTYKSVQIVGTISPTFGFEKEVHEVDKIIKEINKVKPHILFIGLGFPKQELFINEYRDRLNVNLIIGVGASFEFASGIIKRAPKWMQDFALEWLYRLNKEPKRLWKRYLFSNTSFILLFAKMYFKKVFRQNKNNI